MVTCPVDWYLYAPTATCLRIFSLSGIDFYYAVDHCQSYGGDVAFLGSEDIQRFVTQDMVNILMNLY